MPPAPPPAVSVPTPAPWDPARPWLPQAQARLAAAQQAEREAVRAASFGQGTTEAVAKAQRETREAQHQVNQLARRLAVRVAALPDAQRAARSGEPVAQEDLDRLLRDVASIAGVQAVPAEGMPA